MTQTDALKSIVQRFSIKETDVISMETRKNPKELSPHEIAI
jgi:hypothetical protein